MPTGLGAGTWPQEDSELWPGQGGKTVTLSQQGQACPHRESGGTQRAPAAVRGSTSVLGRAAATAQARLGSARHRLVLLFCSREKFPSAPQ